MFIEYWIGFIVFIIGLIALDLGVFRKKSHEMSLAEALSWTFFWISLALIFNLVIYFMYTYLDFPHMNGVSGEEAALQFFTGYLIEKSLSLDNIFVISLIFTYYQIPLKYQHRVLTYGILTAIILRGVLIICGVALVEMFTPILYFFGAFLVFSGWRLFFTDENKEKGKTCSNPILTRLAKIIPITSSLHGHDIFFKENGLWKATPLFLALVQIEFSDVVFAVDSIPAIFSVTLDPFIIYTSNIFAILGLRSLYFMLAPLIERFRYLKSSLALLLVFIGVKMLVVDIYKIPNLASLAVIFLILAGGVLVSIFYPKTSLLSLKQVEKEPSLWTSTFMQIKRVIVFIVGTTVLLFGVLLIFIPGPAFVVIPLGLLLLSTEFVWAKRFLTKVKDYMKNRKL